MTQPTRRQLANAIRFLAADAVEAAKSGHPGMPMGMADIAEVLWNDFFRHNPNNPQWFNRDRFVLSNGHGSMLQYALLHLSGYDLPIEQLKQFRQLHSKTAGHPERSETPGIETTTGPLGQGFANAVGFALAEKLLAQRYNRPELEIVDHRTWVFMGDGCMMEGISHEAASLAGTWGLGKLVAFWDNNHISIDGNTDGWFSDNTPARFEAYGWHVIRDVDGHDAEKIKAAIEAALENTDKPTLICCRTKIGFGAPSKAGKESSHGAPLGKEELEGARKALEWPYGPFEIPEEIYAGWRAGGTGTLRQAEWEQLFDKYGKQYAAEAAELTRRSHAELPADFIAQADAYIAKAQQDGQTIASRKASQLAIEAFAPLLPELIGGSADLAHSNLTLWKASKSVATDDPDANYVYYGVREFGMTAIANGLALHGGFIPFDATFLVFSDYARNGVRMSALNPAHAIHVYTHDSIGLGEDGPTHQPVEAPGFSALHPQQRCVAPGRCGGIGGELEGRHHPQGRPELPGVQSPEPAAPAAQRRADQADRTRWLRAGRCRRRRAGRDPDRDRFGSWSGGGSQADAGCGRVEDARGVDAVHRCVRSPGCGLSRVGVAERGAQARGGGSGRDRLLAQVRGPGWRCGRHRHLRRLGTGGSAVCVLQDHRRACSGGSQGAVRPGVLH